MTLIYLLTTIGLTPGGSSTVHIYTQTIHRTTQLTTLVWRLSGIRTQNGQNKINGELTAWKLSPNLENCRRLCELYPRISLTTEEKARKTSVRVVKLLATQRNIPEVHIPSVIFNWIFFKRHDWLSVRSEMYIHSFLSISLLRWGVFSAPKFVCSNCWMYYDFFF